jgi:uncharacterized protein YyaL (SSP411 family)
MNPSASVVSWLAWGDAPFTRARAEQKPVLLFLGPAWSYATRRVLSEAYADWQVVGRIAERFVPVRVDVDRRPDLGERYTIGGWPTTAFLSPGGDLLGGGIYVEAAPLAGVLEQVSEAYANRRDDFDRPLTAAGSAPTSPVVGPSGGAFEWLESTLVSTCDRDWGGFGDPPKRFHVDALEAVLLGREAGASEAAGLVDRTLDLVVDGELWDRVEGGYFRCSQYRDWTVPHVEKLLGLNARLLTLLLTAAERFDRTDCGERAADLVRFVHQTFADSQGGFFSSQLADPAYSGLDSLELRRERAAPAIDRTVQTDSSAAMASAYVHGARVLQDDSLLEFAATAIDQVVMETYERGAGVGHVSAPVPSVRGLLTDQVSASEASLDLFEASGQEAYLDMPRELMAYCEHTMWSPEGFCDRARNGLVDEDAPFGLLREPHHPLVLNCRAAVVLMRLAGLTGESHYADDARRTLASQSGRYRAQGLDGAAYPLAELKIDRASRPEPS